MGLPVEERESGENIASADVRPYFERADEPVEAEHGSNSAKTGHNLGTTALAVGLHISIGGPPDLIPPRLNQNG